MRKLKKVTQWLGKIWLLLLILGSALVRLDWVSDSASVNVESIFAPSSFQHWLGTDSLGRDFLIRILQGSGVSLMIAFQAIIISIFFAILYGGFSGWSGRRIDLILMMGLDVWLSLPSAVLAAIIGLLLSQLSDSLFVVSFVIGSTHWGRLARLIRGEVIRIREKNFIKASESLGASSLQILRFHIVPHLYAVIGIYVIYQIPSLILAESFLSFIGLGVQAPQTSWGILLQDGWRSLQVYPHVVFFPAVFLFFTVLALNSLLSKNTSE